MAKKRRTKLYNVINSMFKFLSPGILMCRTSVTVTKSTRTTVHRSHFEEQFQSIEYTHFVANRSKLYC